MHKIVVICLGLLMLCSSNQSVAAQNTESGSLESLVNELGDGSLKDNFRLATRLAGHSDPRTMTILSSWLNGNLYLAPDTNRYISLSDGDGAILAMDVLGGQALGSVDKKSLKKIRSNNRIRKQLRELIANMQLKDPDHTTRMNAVNQLIGKADQGVAERLIDLIDDEPDSEIASAMQTAIDLERLAREQAGDAAMFNRLSNRLEPEVRNTLAAIAAGDNSALAKLAAKAVGKIDDRRALLDKFKTVFFGLSLGSVLVLAAIGLAITFGVMGVINMAHGELIMIGAYTTYIIQLLMPDTIGIALIVSIPAAFLVSALVGMLIERSVIRHLYGRPLETLLATFGISLILQQAVRSIFSPLNRSVTSPDWMSGSVEINGALSLTLNRLYIIAFCLLVFAGIYLVMKYSRLGLQMRAVSQNRNMARAMGIRVGRVDMLTFGLGSGIAGVAGVALSQLTNVGPNLGQAYIIDSFMVVVFGGVGNLWGTLVSGFSLGVANKLLEPWSGAVLAKIAILVFIILFIQRRPQGLFPQRGRVVD